MSPPRKAFTNFWGYLASLGKTRECGEMAEKFLKRYPGFSIAEHMTKHIIERDDQREHYIDGLKQACLPD